MYIVYDFLFRFTSNIWPVLALLLHTRLQGLSDLDIDLTRSLKDICDSAVRYVIFYWCLIITPVALYLREGLYLRNISLRKLIDLDINLPRSQKSNVIAPIDSPYRFSYKCLTVTYSLTVLLDEI